MTRAEIESQVWQAIRERRTYAAERARANYMFAKQNVQFLELEKKIRSIELEIAKANYSEKSVLEKEKEKLEQAKVKILKSMGLKAEDLKPIPYCSECGDTGLNNGKHCKCFKTLLLSKLIENSGINIKELVDFSQFDEKIGTTSEQIEQLKNYKKFLIELSKKFPNQKYKCFTICGKTGTGKTFGSKCLIKEVIKKQESALFVSSYEMSSLFLKYHTAFIQDKNEIIDTLLEPELLVIDDLGAEPIFKNVTKEYLYVVITERILSGKTTFITTNLSLVNLIDRYGERIFSRLTDKKLAQIIELKGEDLRHIK